MYIADLQHPSKQLQEKLYRLYNLRADKTPELGFRPEFIRLLEAFGNPHQKLPPVIHVAGTNGKGSTIAILKAILEAMGLRVHVFTSPHLRQFNERIVLAGRYIDNRTLEQLIDEALHLNQNEPVSFFEITTAMAFAAFARVQADVTLLEVGLGGRLDCTNIIEKPAVSIINKISYDHMEYLGNTLSAIAFEKAGIIKKETPCVIGTQTEDFMAEEAMYVFEDVSGDKNAPLICAGQEWSCVAEGEQMRFRFGETQCILPRPSLPGAHQIENAGAALAALKILENQFGWNEEAINRGLQNIYWPARMERIVSGPLESILPQGWELWFDGGHNDTASDAIKDQMIQWKNHRDSAIHLIVALKGDKKADRFLTGLLPLSATLTVTDIHGVGSFVTKKDFENLMARHFPDQDFTHQADLKSAVQHVVNMHGSGAAARILICGSLYLGRQVYG